MAISTLYPASRPSLTLDFTKSKKLDPKISLTRTQTGNIASYVDANGIIRYAGADAPRFDHDPTTGESLGLLIEETRYNKTKYSDFSNPSALGNVVRSTTNSTTTPDGTSTFAFEANNNTSVTHRVVLTNGNIGSATTPHVASFFIKIPPIGSNQISSQNVIRLTIRWRSSSGSGTGAVIDYTQSTQQWTIQGGVNAFGTNSPSTYNPSTAGMFIEAWPNDWYRVVAPGAICSSDPVRAWSSYDWNISETSVEQGGNCTVFFWGAQMETGTYATSYIPTDSSGKTRNGDITTIDVGSGANELQLPDFSNGGESTMICEFTCSDGVGSNVAAAFSAGTHNGGSFIAIGSNSTLEPFIRNRVSGTNYVLTTDVSSDTSNFVKVGYVINPIFNKMVSNDNVFTDTSVSYDNGSYSKLIIGKDQLTGENNRIFGSIKRLLFYSSSLTSNHLLSLTK